MCSRQPFKSAKILLTRLTEARGHGGQFIRTPNFGGYPHSSDERCEFPAIREKYRESLVFETDLGAGSAQKHARSLRFLREFPRDQNREA